MVSNSTLKTMELLDTGRHEELFDIWERAFGAKLREARPEDAAAVFRSMLNILDESPRHVKDAFVERFMPLLSQEAQDEVLTRAVFKGVAELAREKRKKPWWKFW